MTHILSMRRPKQILLLSALWISLFFLFRLGFLFSFWHLFQPLDLTEVFKALYLGLKFDFRLSMLVLIPVMFFMLLPKIKLNNVIIVEMIAKVYLYLMAVILVIFYALDIGHFSYLSERTNASVLRFMDDAAISAQMLWQSYPIMWIVLGIASIIATMLFFISKILSLPAQNNTSPHKTIHKWLVGLLLGIFVFTGLYGQLSAYPLRWSNAMFSQNQLITATAVNPVLFFYRTLKNKKQTYTEKDIQQAYPVVKQLLKGHYIPSDTPYSLAREIKTTLDPQAPPPNIVIIMLESLANNFMGAAGNPLKPTPFMDSLIERSIYFKKHYVPWQSTAKSTWSVLTGIPDPTAIKTATRNPLIARQHMMLADLKEYDKYYFLGGSANWANIRGFLQQSLPDLIMYEEGDYDEYPVEDVWGVSDENLLRKAHTVLTERKTTKPFIAYIQTAANHAPYTIPASAKNFTVDPISLQQANAAGFADPEQYNAVRLLDHTLKNYMSWVEQSDYADNTIFLFFGDHGKPVPKADNMGLDAPLNLFGFRSAAWLYTKVGKTPAQVIEKNVSLIDLIPTVMSLTNQKVINTTLGQNILKQTINDPYIMLLQRDLTGIDRVGYLNNRFYLEVDIDGNNGYLKDLNSTDLHKNVADQHPELYQRLTKEVISLFYMSHYLLINNKPLN